MASIEVWARRALSSKLSAAQIKKEWTDLKKKKKVMADKELKQKRQLVSRQRNRERKVGLSSIASKYSSSVKEVNCGSAVVDPDYKRRRRVARRHAPTPSTRGRACDEDSGVRSPRARRAMESGRARPLGGVGTHGPVVYRALGPATDL